MPFRSKSQQRYMFLRHPEMAKRWEKHTPEIKELPEKMGAVKRKLKSWKPEGYR